MTTNQSEDGLYATRSFPHAQWLFYVLSKEYFHGVTRSESGVVKFWFWNDHPDYTCEKLIADLTAPGGAGAGNALQLMETAYELRRYKAVPEEE